MTGTVVVLNGTSSAGKTTTARALQQVLPDPFLYGGIDWYIGMLPEDHQRAGLAHDRLLSGMPRCVAALAASGNNVIVDAVVRSDTWLHEWAVALHSHRAYFVGVRCPLAVVEQRERGRGDRTPGQARGQIEDVHVHAVYDADVDTSIYTPEQCAVLIRDRLLHGPPPTAFAALHRRFQHVGADIGRACSAAEGTAT